MNVSAKNQSYWSNHFDDYHKIIHTANGLLVFQLTIKIIYLQWIRSLPDVYIGRYYTSLPIFSVVYWHSVSITLWHPCFWRWVQIFYYSTSRTNKSFLFKRRLLVHVFLLLTTTNQWNTFIKLNITTQLPTKILA